MTETNHPPLSPLACLREAASAKAGERHGVRGLCAIRKFVSFYPFEKNEFQDPKNQKNHHKIPLVPPFSKWETMFSSLCKREVGRDFQNAKMLQ